MTYKPNPDLKTPSEVARIWRYMDFAKFVSLLDRGALHFPRAGKLGDPFEGSLTEKDVAAIGERRTRYHATVADAREGFHRFAMMGAFVSCWHVNEHESAAMWDLYSGRGIAVQSTIGRLTESFHVNDDFTILVGSVKYIDYTVDEIPLDNFLYRLLTKRLSFEHEREVRAIYLADYQVDFERPLDGHYIPIDLDRLVESVIVAPQTPSWFREVVVSVCGRYALNKPVVISSLEQRPLY